MERLSNEDVRELELRTRMQFNYWLVALEKDDDKIWLHHQVSFEEEPDKKTIDNVIDEIKNDPEIDIDVNDNFEFIVLNTNDYNVFMDMFSNG